MLPKDSTGRSAVGRVPSANSRLPLPDGLRFYDLRHTCASLLITQGASITADDPLSEPAGG